MTMRSERVCGRFAPSPSGRLHLGNLMSSLLAWLDVRSQDGVMLFRLEDLDPERSWEHYADQMADDLRWLGLDWDIGWEPGRQDYRQGTRGDFYAEKLQQLRDMGLVYECFCSRSERLAASAPHPGEPHDRGCGCRDLTEAQKGEKRSLGRRASLKLHVPERTFSWTDGHYGEQTDILSPGGDDFIIRRSDGVFAYQLAVSADDMDMGVNRVVRARDLLGSTARQMLLIELFGGEVPAYCHAPLLVAPEGRKLSKRDGDLSTEGLRERYTPEQLTGKLAKLAGLRETDEPVHAWELVSDFSWDKVPTEPIVIDDNL